jgi:hypothetical protein
MLANLFWLILFGLVLLVPGRLSVMYTLLAALVIAFALWQIFKPRRPARHVASPSAGYEAGANGETVAVQVAPADGHAEAAAFEEQARVLDQEREEAELLAQNAEQHQVAIAAAEQDVLTSQSEVERPWQERLENGYRP